MKEKIVIVVSILVVFVLLTLAVADYRQYNTEQDAQRQAEITAWANREQEWRALENDLRTRINDLVAECDKGAAAYELLTTKEQEELGLAPSCGVGVIE